MRSARGPPFLIFTIFLLIQPDCRCSRVFVALEKEEEPMKKGEMAGYAITHDKLILKFILEDGEEIEVPIKASVATTLGDDIFHGMYTGEDDEGKAIHSISRIFDPASESVLESDNDIKYEPEKG
jgi:hypothetical protein